MTWPNLKVKDFSNQHRNPAIFWAFIILLMILSAISVQMLGNKPHLSSNITPTPEASKQPRLYTVSYRSGVFSPTNLRIHAGDTVRFKNESFFGIRIKSDNNQLPGLDSIGDIPQGSYFSYTFSEIGIFGYHNDSELEEQGTIIVR